MNVGPDLLKDNLVFGLDTGYGAANIGTPTRHFKGKPTTNLTTSTLTPVFSSWSGLVGTSTTYTGGYLGNSGVHVKITSGGGVNWWSSPSLTGLSGDTQYTVSATMRFTGRVFNGNDPNILYIREYNSSNNQLRELGYFSSNRMLHLGGGWYRIWGTVTTQATTNRILLHGYSYDTNSDIKLQDLQFEAGDTASPFAGYNGSRSDTASLIDLKRTTSIDAGDMSFTSTAQPTFDGTDDSISLADNFDLNDHFVDGENFTIEVVVKMNESASENGGVICNQKYQSETDPAGFGLVIRNANQYALNLTNSTPTSYQHIAPIPFNVNSYHHIAYTFNSSTGNVVSYSNGSQYSNVTNSSYSWNIPTDSTRTYIGYNTQGGWSNYIDMDIPVAKIYSKALTATEIKQNYNAYKNRFNI